MRARGNEACAVSGFPQPRLFVWALRHHHPRPKHRASDIRRRFLVQPLYRKPNLVLALDAIDVHTDAGQSLHLVLVESEETMCSNGGCGLAPQPRGLPSKFDKGEEPISFDAHEISRGGCASCPAPRSIQNILVRDTACFTLP